MRQYVVSAFRRFVRPLLRSAHAVAGRGPGRRVTKASDEREQTFKISVLRDEGDALLTAGNRDQRIVEKRRLVVQHLPTFICGDGGENTAAFGESHAGWRKNAPASFKGFEYTLLHIARHFHRPRACA